MKMFVPMHKVLKPVEHGNVRVESFTVTESQSCMTSIDPRNFVPPGRYTRLWIGGTLMMSDTPVERRSNYGIVFKARGDVLIAGLGIGMILVPILAKKEVTSVTVIEKSADVIEAVGKQFMDKRLTVIHGDIYEWRPPAGRTWDAIYFDIWAEQSTDVLQDMAKLHRRFARRKNPGGWMSSWNFEYLQYRRRQERARGW